MAQDLADLNPWWRSANWATDDADLRTVRGTGLGYRSACLDDLVQGGLYLVRGPRRVGKTVASKQKIAELIASGVSATSIVRIAADGWSAEDLRTVIQNVPLPHIPEGTRRWWFIDDEESRGTGVTAGARGRWRDGGCEEAIFLVKVRLQNTIRLAARCVPPAPPDSAPDPRQ